MKNLYGGLLAMAGFWAESNTDQVIGICRLELELTSRVVCSTELESLDIFDRPLKWI